jgi:hypothetical protein
LEEHGAERIEVGSLIDGACLDLLRCEVGRRARDAVEWVCRRIEAGADRPKSST